MTLAEMSYRHTSGFQSMSCLASRRRSGGLPGPFRRTSRKVRTGQQGLLHPVPAYCTRLM